MITLYGSGPWGPMPWPPDYPPLVPVPFPQPVIVPAGFPEQSPRIPQPDTADLAAIPGHVVDGLVKLLPTLKDALREAKRSGDADEVAALTWLEGVAYQKGRAEKESES